MNNRFDISLIMKHAITYIFLSCMIIIGIILCLFSCDDDIMPLCIFKHKTPAKVYYSSQYTDTQCVTIFSVGNSTCFIKSDKCIYNTNHTYNLYVNDDSSCQEYSYQKTLPIIGLSFIGIVFFGICILFCDFLYDSIKISPVRITIDL